MIESYDTLLHSSLNLKRSFEKSAKISIYLCRIVDIDKNNRAHVYVYSENPHDAFLVPIVSSSVSEDTCIIDPPKDGSIGVYIQIGRRESFVMGVFDFFSESNMFSNGMDRLMRKEGSSIRQNYMGDISMKSSGGARTFLGSDRKILNMSESLDKFNLYEESLSFEFEFEAKTYLCKIDLIYSSCSLPRTFTINEINDSTLVNILSRAESSIASASDNINHVQNFREIKNKKLADVVSFVGELESPLQRDLLFIKETGLAFNSIIRSYSDILNLKETDVSLSGGKPISFREKILLPAEEVLVTKTY